METTLWYEKPKALTELTTRNHGIIAASAGTGKTYTLQHLLVEILLTEDVRLDEILLVTFTVAATSDLKRKIREMFEGLIRGWERARALGLNEALLSHGEVVPAGEIDEAEKYWKIEIEGVERLRHGLRNFDRAAIYTIHGFCQRVLVEHAFANKRLFDQEHVSEDDVIAEAFAEMLREDIRPGTEEQQWLTIYLGSGKQVEGLRDELSKYVKCRGEYRPDIPADLQEFEEFIQDLGAAISDVDAEAWYEETKPKLKGLEPTYHQAKAIRDRLQILQNKYFPGHKPGKTVENLSLFLEVFGGKSAYFRDEKPQIVLAMADWGELLAQTGRFDQGVELFVVAVLGEKLRTRVADLKEREGYFTFDDMVQIVRDTLVDGEDGGHLLKSIRGQFRYGLIDEFQDTDSHQWEIFSKVFVEETEEHFLYIIGDPKQAIYGFRGGDVYAYLDARARLRELGADEASLKMNFRSTPQVIAAYNAVFEEGIELGEDIEYPAGGVVPGTFSGGLEGVDGSAVSGMTLMSMATGREEIDVDRIRDGLARCYGREIAEILAGGRWRVRGDDSEVGENIGAEDIYVLCRRTADLYRVADALRDEGVAFAFMKMAGLFQTREAMDIFDLLLALDDPYDRSRRARAWMTPFFDLTLKDIETIAAIDEGDPVFQKLLGWSRLAQRRDFGTLFDTIVEESGLIRRRLFLERGERELTNYLHLLEILTEEAARRVYSVEELAMRLKAFVDKRAAPEGEDREQQRLETEERAVQLLTIHGSKGLERGVVFVFPKFSGISKRNAPFRFHDHSHRPPLAVEWYGSHSQMTDDEKEWYEREATAEELRLAYVALTRAKLQVYLPFAEKDGVIYEKIEKDPFTRLIDRIAGLRDDDRARFFDWSRQIDVDGVRPRRTEEEVRRGLEELGDSVELIMGSEKVPGTPLERKKELMRRRWEVTSYSKLKTRASRTEREDEKGDSGGGSGPLPGGMATGNFLHLVMEELDYWRVDEFDRRGWVDDPEIDELFCRAAARFGSFDDQAMAKAKEFVFDTLRAPVVLGEASILDGVRRLDGARVEKEVEFLFPVAEMAVSAQGGKELRRTFGSGAEIRGGFVTGIVDLLFEYEGKLYFADWKSDLASPYDEESLRQKVEEHYSEQAMLYSLAMCRMLGIDNAGDYEEHFGGYFYFFIRGMTPDRQGRGIYSGRVDWADLLEYEAGLMGRVESAKTEWLDEEGAI